MKNISIAIIGGGASGMMSAVMSKLNNPDAKVTLFEKNSKLGVKVMISGGGRCNVTTADSDLAHVLTRYPRGSHFLKTAMYEFPPVKVRDYFESRGVGLKVEADGRVFPKSDNGADIVQVFLNEFQKYEIDAITNCKILSIQKSGEKFTVTTIDGKPELFDKVILTCGGNAYQSTGSTGDGYDFAKSCGHTITPLAPSLTSFKLSDTFCKELAGLTIPDVILSEKKTGAHYRHSMLFTHTGITGPVTFALSSLTAFEKYDPVDPMILEIDLLPDIKQNELEKLIFSKLESSPKQLFINILHTLKLPKSLCGVLLDQCTIPHIRRFNEISHKDIRKCIVMLKNFQVHAVGRGQGDEFVTAGGVELTEVNAKTMESKICSGLYFAGEILDIDGFTGGYNLQSAWSTGYLAGKHASQL